MMLECVQKFCLKKSILGQNGLAILGDGGKWTGHLTPQWTGGHFTPEQPGHLGGGLDCLAGLPQNGLMAVLPPPPMD